MMNERWRTSIHEAGHAIASITLGGRCDGVLLNAVGGLAICDDLTGDQFAFMAAAGPAGEILLQHHEAPEAAQASYKEVAEEKMLEVAGKEFATVCMFADVEQPPSTQKSDDRHIAEWAIGGRETDPGCWARRVNLAKYVAGKIVAEHAAAIVRVAERLYVEGRVPGQQIEILMQNQEATA